ncbi:MAG: hypothetical protein AAF639_31835 [Chloroflexota bacterium]
MKKWSFKWGRLEFSHEAESRADGDDKDSPWGAIAVFLALASLIIQALQLM